jgi:hypothetical protein
MYEPTAIGTVTGVVPLLTLSTQTIAPEGEEVM